MSKQQKGSPKAHEVGYGRPPKAGRFIRGKSGNPKGRPKKQKDLSEILRSVAFRPMTIRENGKTRKVPAIEAHFMKLMNKALEGDAKAGNQILRLLPLLAAASSSDGEGLTPEQIRELDQEILSTFFKEQKKTPALPEPRVRKRRSSNND